VPGPAIGQRADLVDSSRAPSVNGERTLAQVAEWARHALQIDHVQVFWRTLARKPRLLEAAWAKHRLVLTPHELSAELKAAVALAVAMNAHSDYWIAYFDHFGRVRAGFDDDVVAEIAGAVMHYVAFNTISHGMMLEAPHRDVVAGDFAPETPSRSE
jgi:hypothetical protein